MAGPYSYRSPCQNSSPAGKDKFVSTARTEGSNTLIPTPAVLRARTPALAIALFSDNKLFKQFMKAYLKTQVQAWIVAEIDPKPCKQSFKAWFSDFYYDNLHMDCHQFCQ